MSNKKLIKELIETIKEDVTNEEFTSLIHLIEVLLGFEVNKQIIEEYLSWEYRLKEQLYLAM